MRTYTLFCVDFDGTIMDTMPAFLHSMRGAAERLGRTPPPDEHTGLAMGMGSLARCVTFLFPDIPEDHTGPWVTAYRDIYRTEGAALARPYPGVVETLEALLAAGKRLAVTSNKGEPLLRSGLADHNLLQYFELVIGELPGEPKKPDPDTWRRRVAPHFPGVAVEDVLVVGDGEPDMAFAKALGAAACLATYGYGPMDRLVQYNPLFRINAFADIADHL
ncbi:HAD family hydrolase [Megalodesulfovibrio gigas]|uniref:phosphoglycolate phosphatase n=1 Tax=Megalodesulfovibrio gigas (strain ATCC 19364 / DSM 1382 / NCIMB 9332 / VKM B-1759) TaxID=1121448 RepID=T2G9J6_MEGG1|nr:HAD family hydrolase [Megalodesulfovibrio gigas]AGW12854.1 putative phosphoglycolate phosphatase [Megalodesulfovibrio gigas DSM 1382 = ATCC 19364]